MTKRNALTQLKARSLPEGKYADGQGLWLVKSRSDAGRWVLRLVVGGKRREMGLGRYPDVSIAEARESAGQARQVLRSGSDPIAERQKRAGREQCVTVADAVAGCFAARQAELKQDGAAGRWLSPLKMHILPAIGNEPIEAVDQHVLRRLLGPLWHEKPESARKALNRMNLTLRHAAALGLNVDLQAVLKTKALLGKQRHTVVHIPSLPYIEAPDFYRWLTGKDLIAAQALRFLILTVTRTSEVRFACFSEIDSGIWCIPAERTKAGKGHRVPLANEARAVLAEASRCRGGDLVFPSRSGRPLSDAALSRFMEREGFSARPHGFRATFRTWVEETTDTPFEVKESVLGHQVDGDVVRAYQRSDRLEKRRNLMEAWSAFLISRSA